MTQEIFGVPGLPVNADFVIFNNEDIGLVANLATGTNDIYAFAMPYPASMDLMTQSIVVWAIEMWLQRVNSSNDDIRGWLEAHFSMLDREYPATYRGTLTDATDEAMKAQFASCHFGLKFYHPTDAALAGPIQWNQDVRVDAVVIPPVPLDLITPLNVQLINQTITVDPATQDDTAVDFTEIETFMMRVWFTLRNLSRLEIAFRNQQLRFQRLDS